MGWLGDISRGAAGVATLGGTELLGIGEDIGNGVDDISGANNKDKNTADYFQTYGTPDIQWGGDPNAANDWSQLGLNRMNDSNANVGAMWEGALGQRGPQAWENQQLSDNEAFSRGWDQNGALQLAREAAMGQSPSQAQYLMQHGLDQSLAAQQAQMGSARGNAGVALAGGNAAGNSANLMNQTYNQMGAMRANEMANAMGMYGGLAGQQREQDQSRLQMGNQMSQFNAGLNDQFRLGLMGTANNTSNQGLGWYQAAQQPQNQAMQGNVAAHQIGSGAFQSAQGNAGDLAKFNAGQQDATQDRLYRTAGTLMNTAAQKR